jgi:hypothetical protein
MAFRPPTFNLAVKIWRTATPYAGVAAVTTTGNLSLGKRVLSLPQQFSGGNMWPEFSEVLLPKLTDVRGIARAGASGDLLECPAGSGRTYYVLWVEDVGKGFPNEYRVAVCVQNTAYTLSENFNTWAAPPWPLPTP